MHSDIFVGDCVFGGGANGIFGDAVLCVGVFYFCGVDDFDFWVFVVVIFDCVGGGECAWVVSDESDYDGVGTDDGATHEIYFATGGACNCARDYVGGGDAAIDFGGYGDEKF